MRHKFSISISIQISIFLIIVAFIPVAIMMALKTYEKQQLNMMENSNVQQGRIIASSLLTNDGETINEQFAHDLIKNMRGEFDSRIRILDSKGNLLVDSSRIYSGIEEEDSKQIVSREDAGSVSNQKKKQKGNFNQTAVYRILSFPIRLYRKWFRPPRAPYGNADFYRNKTVYDGDEIIAALNGKYGATTRFSTGGQVSVTLYSAIPVKNDDTVVGVVLVSRSTYKILQNLYELRVDLGKIFLRSLLVVILIALFLGFRIVYPLKKLSKQTSECADKKGRILFTDFTGKKRQDEIGEVSRSFSSLIERLNKKIKFSQAYSSDISHEFKNPLTAIRTSAELLGDKSLSEQERNELSIAIVDEVTHLQDLITGVRNISKIDSGAMEEENQVLPVNIYTKNLISRLQKHHENVDVEFFCETEELELLIPQDYFDRVAENLIDNAMSFGNKVFVQTAITKKENKEYFELSVEDNGKGVSSEQMEKIFNRFYSERPDSKNTNHTGLGLSIVKAIADNLEGEILVSTSKKLGGAKFLFIIPTSK